MLDFIGLLLEMPMIFSIVEFSVDWHLAELCENRSAVEFRRAAKPQAVNDADPFS
jgi:hypothetical protein